MVWEKEVHVIVMLTQLEEKGKVRPLFRKVYIYAATVYPSCMLSYLILSCCFCFNIYCFTFLFIKFIPLMFTIQEQCSQYWPDSLNSPEKNGSLSIELLSEKQFEDYILRELKVSDVTVSDYMTAGVLIHW